MGSGLGDEGPLMGPEVTGQRPPLRPRPGAGGLLGSGPEMQGFPEDIGNAPGSVLGTLPYLTREGVEACCEGQLSNMGVVVEEWILGN